MDKGANEKIKLMIQIMNNRVYKKLKKEADQILKRLFHILEKSLIINPK